MESGNHFIVLYNELCSFLRKKTGLLNDAPFSQLLMEASRNDPTIQRWKSFLQAMGDLRNAIVHYRRYPPEIIADPRPEIVERFEKTIEKIKSPAKVIPAFTRKIEPFSEDTQLDAILAHMEENDYSQVVIKIGNEYRLLSSEGIVRWLCSARKDGLADIESAIVREVWAFEEKKTHLFMACSSTIDEAILAFDHAIARGIPRLQAILITHSGKFTEKPLGIITAWDLIKGTGDNDMAR